MEIRPIGIVLLVTVGLSACAPSAGSGAAGSGEGSADAAEASREVTPPLPSRWQFRSIAGQPVKGERAVTLDFDETGSVSGFSGCNRFTGKALIENGKIRLSPLAATRMACLDGDLMAQEQAVMNVLGNIERVMAAPEGSIDLHSTDAPAPSRLVPAP